MATGNGRESPEVPEGRRLGSATLAVAGAAVCAATAALVAASDVAGLAVLGVVLGAGILLEGMLAVPALVRAGS